MRRMGAVSIGGEAEETLVGVEVPIAAASQDVAFRESEFVPRRLVSFGLCDTRIQSPDQDSGCGPGRKRDTA
jgi:hypothetical protein